MKLILGDVMKPTDHGSAEGAEGRLLVHLA